jgi:hypothetical protein
MWLGSGTCQQRRSRERSGRSFPGRMSTPGRRFPSALERPRTVTRAQRRRSVSRRRAVFSETTAIRVEPKSRRPRPVSTQTKARRRGVMRNQTISMRWRARRGRSARRRRAVACSASSAASATRASSCSFGGSGCESARAAVTRPELSRSTAQRCLRAAWSVVPLTLVRHARRPPWAVRQKTAISCDALEGCRRSRRSCRKVSPADSWASWSESAHAPMNREKSTSAAQERGVHTEVNTRHRLGRWPRRSGA